MGKVNRTVFGCPSCQARVTGQEQACPVCGIAFTSETKFECPFCGVMVPRGSETCPSCGLGLRLPEEKTVEATLDQILDDVTQADTKSGVADGKRVGCPRCSHPLTGSEERCPICFFQLTLASQIQCPSCGSTIPSTSKVCPNCEWVPAGPDEIAGFVKESPERVQEPTSEVPQSAETEEEGELAMCPVCRKDSPSDALTCPHCGTEFEPVSDLGGVEKPIENGRTIDQAVLKLDTLQDLAEKSAPSRRRKLKAAGPRSPKVPSMESKDTAGRLGKVDGTGFVNGRRLGLDSGVTNGRGFVNGRGAINGLGAVNGISMVNGRGASNGLGVKSHQTRLSMRHRLVQSRVLVVLAATMVVMSAAYVMSSIGPSDDFAIDGDFGDWGSVQSYPAQKDTTSTGINIQEWSAVFSGNDFYYYIRTESDAMAGSSVESFCMFIDTDSSSTTGYHLGEIGAEYRLMLDGWNGTMYSSSVSSYSYSDDHLNWNGWISAGSSEAVLRGDEIEGHAQLSDVTGSSPKVIIISKDETENLCFSVPVPLGSSLLVIDQAPAPDVANSGIVGLGPDVQLLRLTLSALGGSGTVTAITPATAGCEPASSFTPREVRPGADVIYDFSVDTSISNVTQLVSATISEENLESDFDSVLILGTGAKTYLAEPPENVAIDGAFADWVGRTSLDTDFMPIQSENVDIQETGASNTSQSAFFFVSVRGEMFSGAYLPKVNAKPIPGAGGSHVTTRKTAEDFTRVYIDTDMSSATGQSISYETKAIGADRMIEVRGLFGRIVSSTISAYENGEWIDPESTVEAENDEKRVEIAVSLSDLGSESEFEFLFETTCWNRRSDLASFDPDAFMASAISSSLVGTRAWPIDTSVTPTTATAMSYQRKLIHDGTNFWSFFYDGSGTIYKYSSNGGASWTSRGQVFTTSDINEVSIWYDSANNIVYAIGDSTAASTNVYVKRGTVSPSTATISWGPDYAVGASTLSYASKNTFICKADDGYLWLIAQDYLESAPVVKHNLAVWKSNSTDDISGWTFSDNMLGAQGDSYGTLKGTIVPAGSNGYVWAIYTYGGYVKSKKFDGAWPNNPQDIYSATGTLKENTVTAAPSVVVDARGVVHVVYGDSEEASGVAYTRVCYKRNNTDAETYPTNPTYLDSSKPSNVADISPTISLETSTGDLYAFWIQTDTSMVGKTVKGAEYSGGSWTSLTLDTESSYTKQHLTSVYSASAVQNICWEWTQNATTPIEVMFDVIPEFESLVLPVLFLTLMVVIGVHRRSIRPRGRK